MWLPVAVAAALVAGDPDVRMSDAGRTFLMLHEGVRTEAYRDPTGTWTIGVGHTSAAGAPKVIAGMAITTVEASEILSRDLLAFEKDLKRFTPGLTFEQHEFDALLSLLFNIGPGNFSRSTFLRHLKAGDRKKAADAMLAWKYSKGKVLPGLIRRRREERLMFLTGKYTGVRLEDGRSSK